MTNSFDTFGGAPFQLNTAPGVSSLFPSLGSSFSMLGTAATAAGTAVGDQFSAQAAEAQAQAEELAGEGATLQGQQDILEEQNYYLAAKFATENVGFTEASTNMQEAAEQRQAFSTIGSQKAGEAGAGFAESGSALDLLSESNEQAAYGKAAIGFQGGVTEAGYTEQAKAYRTMAGSANLAFQATGITTKEDQLAAQAYTYTADADKAAATAAEGSGILSGVGGALGVGATILKFLPILAA